MNIGNYNKSGLVNNVTIGENVYYGDHYVVRNSSHLFMDIDKMKNILLFIYCVIKAFFLSAILCGVAYIIFHFIWKYW